MPRLSFGPCKKRMLFFVLAIFCFLKKSLGPVKVLGGCLTLMWHELTVYSLPHGTDLAFY